MKFKWIFFIAGLLVYYPFFSLKAQNQKYVGGTGDGYAKLHSTSILLNDVRYQGGDGDGYSKVQSGDLPLSPPCILAPATDQNQIGTQHTVTVTVNENGNLVSGVDVTFTVFKGPNNGQTGAGSSPTDGSGQATFTYASNSTAGTDSIVASGSVNGVPFECFAEKKWVEAVNINDKIGVGFQLAFFNTMTNQFQFEVKIINNSAMTLFAPLFVQFVTIETDPVDLNPPVTIANSDRGGNAIGAVFDYSDLLGGDGQLDPGEMTTFKVWIFDDPGLFNFFIFANVFAFPGGPAPFAKTNSTTGPIRISADIKNHRLEIITGTTDAEEPVPLEIPTEFALQQNYPNPFNPETTIRYELPEPTEVVMIVYNLRGQLVRKLVNQKMEPGFHEIVWDARDDAGRSVPSGVYLYRIQAGVFTEVRKLMLLR